MAHINDLQEILDSMKAQEAKNDQIVRILNVYIETHGFNAEVSVVDGEVVITIHGA